MTRSDSDAYPLDEDYLLGYDLLGAWGQAPPVGRSLLPPGATPQRGCPFCAGGLSRTPRGWEARHSEASCPVRFKLSEGGGGQLLAADERGLPEEPLAHHAGHRLLDEDAVGQDDGKGPS